MSTFTITINNNSNVPRRFLLFQDMPDPTNGPSSQVFTNVYQRSPKIQSGDDSRVSFQMKQEYFAIYGTGSESSDGSVRVYTSSSVPVKLGPGGTTVVVTTQDGQGDDPAWDKAAASGQSTGAKGGFSIVTDTSFKFLNPSKAILLKIQDTAVRRLTCSLLPPRCHLHRLRCPRSQVAFEHHPGPDVHRRARS